MYAVARRVDRMVDLADAGVGVFGMDVTDDASMTSGVERILDEHGRIDVLVNNAGYGSYGAVEDVPLDEARRQFEVNVFGLARLTQLVTPAMREQGSGRIINISSVGAVIYEPFGAWYHATKFAVDGFSDSLRVELAPFGIDVVIVRPAGIRTEWNQIARDGLIESAQGGAYEQMRSLRGAPAGERRQQGPVQRPEDRGEDDREGRDHLAPAVGVRHRTRRPDGHGVAAVAAGPGVRRAS